MTIIKTDDGKGKKKHLQKQPFHDTLEWRKLLKDMRVMTQIYHMSMDAIGYTVIPLDILYSIGYSICCLKCDEQAFAFRVLQLL